MGSNKPSDTEVQYIGETKDKLDNGKIYKVSSAFKDSVQVKVDGGLVVLLNSEFIKIRTL